MGKYDDEDAAGQAKADAATDWDDIAVLSKDRLKEAFPDPGDLDAAERLIRVIEKSTDKNLVMNAIKDFAAIATVEGVAALKTASKLAKEILIAALLCLLPIAAGAADLSLGELLSTKAAEMKAVYSLTWPTDEPRHAAGAYLPIQTFTTKDKKRQFVEWGIGVEEPEGSEKPQLILPVMLNIVDLGRQWFSFQWARDHIRSTSLPPIWLGPIWQPPTQLSKSGLKSYVLFHHVGVGMSMRIGSLFTTKKEDPE